MVVTTDRPLQHEFFLQLIITPSFNLYNYSYFLAKNAAIAAGQISGHLNLQVLGIGDGLMVRDFYYFPC